MQAEKSRLSKQETIGTCGKKSLQVPDFFVCKFRGKNWFNGNIFMYLIMSKTDIIKKFHKPLENMSNLRELRIHLKLFALGKDLTYL